MPGFRAARHFAIESKALLPAELFTCEPSRASPVRIMSGSESPTRITPIQSHSGELNTGFALQHDTLTIERLVICIFADHCVDYNPITEDRAILQLLNSSSILDCLDVAGQKFLDSIELFGGVSVQLFCTDQLT